MSASSPSSAMSVVVMTPDTFTAVRETISHLRRQTACGLLEVVIVFPGKEDLSSPSVDLSDFARTRAVEVGPAASTGRAMAAGARAATSPIIAFCEEHSFPDSGWAAALIEAHDGPWAVVGPAIVNANPGTWTGCADYLVSFGRFAPTAPAGEVDELPGHNSAYKRDVLLDLGQDLEDALAYETLFHWRLRKEGKRLCFEPRARAKHLVGSSFFRWLHFRFHKGRRFAATRSHSWPRPRRMLYAGGGPLIPFVRLWRLARAVPRGVVQPANAVGVWATVVVGLLVEAIGEAVGYAFGPGNADRYLGEYELHRADFLSKRDPRRRQSRV